MADPKEECIVISDEEPGAEIISSDDDHESPLSGINSTNGAQPMILIGADPLPEDEQPINGSAYANYDTHGEREAVIIQDISSRGSNSQQIAIALSSRQASLVIVSP